MKIHEAELAGGMISLPSAAFRFPDVDGSVFVGLGYCYLSQFLIRPIVRRSQSKWPELSTIRIPSRVR